MSLFTLRFLPPTATAYPLYTPYILSLSLPLSGKGLTCADNNTTVPRGITHIFLIFNVIVMSSCSFLVIIRKRPEFAVAGLLAVVVVQALGYGLIFDLNFFLRNLSVIGGLLMVLSDSWVRKRVAFPGLPSIDEKDRKMYVQLGGRVLLIFLFIGFVFSGDWGFGRVLVSLIGFVACVMVVVGFKAKFSAILLVVLLSIFNLLVNNFWTVSRIHQEYVRRVGNEANEIAVASQPPTQGLCEIRFLPDTLDRRRSAAAGKYGSRTAEHGREEESVLNDRKYFGTQINSLSWPMREANIGRR